MAMQSDDGADHTENEQSTGKTLTPSAILEVLPSTPESTFSKVTTAIFSIKKATAQNTSSGGYNESSNTAVTSNDVATALQGLQRVQITGIESMKDAEFSEIKSAAKTKRRELLQKPIGNAVPDNSEIAFADQTSDTYAPVPTNDRDVKEKPPKPSATDGQVERTQFMQEQGVFFNQTNRDLLIYAPHSQSGLVKDQPFNNMYISMHHDGNKWRATVGAAQGAELEESEHLKTEDILAIYQAEAVYHVALSIYAEHLAAHMNGDPAPSAPKIAVLSNYLSEGLTGASSETNNTMVAIRRKAIEDFVEKGIPADLLQEALTKIDSSKGPEIARKITAPLPLVLNQKALNLARNSATGSSDVALYEGIKKAFGIRDIYPWPWTSPQVIADVPDSDKARLLLRELQGPAPIYAMRWVAEKVASTARYLTNTGLSFPAIAWKNTKNAYQNDYKTLPEKIGAAFPTAIGFVGVGIVAGLAAIAYGAAIALRLVLMAPNSFTGMLAIGHQRINQSVFYPAQVEKKTAGYYLKRVLLTYLPALILLPILPLTFLRTRGNQSLHREALKIALCEALGIPNPGGCKSAKDREGMVRLLAQSYQEYMQANPGKTPPSMGSTSYYLQKMTFSVMNALRSVANLFLPKEKELKPLTSPANEIDRIFAKNYLAGSAQFVAHANAAYTSGIKNIDFILGGRQIYVIRQEINRQIKDLQAEIETIGKSDTSAIVEKQAQIQRLINCLPENSNALAEGNKDYIQTPKAAASISSFTRARAPSGSESERPTISNQVATPAAVQTVEELQQQRRSLSNSAGASATAQEPQQQPHPIQPKRRER